MPAPWIPGGRERLEREREEAYRRYHEAFDALDRAANDALAAARAEVSDPAAALKDTLARLATFESLLIQFLQKITPYIDTKVRLVEEGVTDATVAATAAQRVAAGAQRALERLAGRGPSEVEARVVGSATVGSPSTSVSGIARDNQQQARAQAGTRTPDPGSDGSAAASYVAFEDVFRGSPETIRARQQDYVPLFAGTRDVLDVGCGRGEFLHLLKDAGIAARGVDLNSEMVEVCRSAGLDVRQSDGVGYLRELADGTLGGLFAAQVVEHLPPETLLVFLREASRVLRPGAPIVLETINPTCWVAFFEAYIRDLTHAKPLHPDTLKFLVVANGFAAAEVRYRTPIAEADRLRRVETSDTSGRLRELVDAFNLNMERLNDRLFTYLDYALIARRA